MDSDYWRDLRYGLRFLTPEELPDEWREKVGQTRFAGIGEIGFDWLDPGRFSQEGFATWRDKYNAYLQSPQWRHKRSIMLYRAGNRCERCGFFSRNGHGLEVHHKTYEHLCNEAWEDLEVLCKPCHEQADMERTNAKTPHD